MGDGKGQPLIPRNNRRKLIYNFGINDYFDSTCINGKHIRSYELWRGMIKRVYSDNKNCYSDCIIDLEWKYFSNFKNDVEKFIGYEKKGWQLDKDILSTDIKIYSRKTCVFIPQELNKLLTHKKSNNTSTIGVRFINGKYMARCSFNSKEIFIGYYDNLEDAQKAYKITKENIIKETVEKYKYQIDERVYNKLINYEIL